MRSFSKIINRETILYGFFGVLTSILNVVLFTALISVEIDYRIANFITLVITKLAAYICNKNWVFRSKTANFYDLAKEFGRFIIARGLTMILDYVGLIALVEFLNMDKVLGKVIITVLVIVINYFTGKSYVFKNEKIE